MNKNAVFDLQNPEMSSRPLGLQQMVPSSAQLRFQKIDKQMRRAVPVMFLGMDLFKCAIHGLDRSKLTDILTTAHENMDVIVDIGKLKRINTEQATELWQEIVTNMGWNPVCKDYIFTVSGNTGKISSKMVADGTAVKMNNVSLDDETPILFDSDWCEKFKQMTRQNKIADVVEAAKLNRKRIESLQKEIQTQKDALVIQNKQIEDLNRYFERNTLENDDIKNQLTELRESVQELRNAQQMVKENTEATLTDGHMASSDSEVEQKQNTSTPTGKTIATFAKSTDTATSHQCWICDKQGHLTKNCPGNSSPLETKTLNGNKSNTKCYSCGGTGHLARECVNTKCYACRGTGHFARDCANTKQNSTRRHSKWPKKN